MSLSTQKCHPSEPAQEEEESGPLNPLSTPPITLSRVALNNINIKIDDTTVSVLILPRAGMAGEKPDF